MTLRLSVQLFNEDCRFVQASRSAWVAALTVHIGLAIGCLYFTCFLLWYVVPRKMWKVVGFVMAIVSATGTLLLIHNNRNHDLMATFLSTVFGYHSFFKNTAVSYRSYPEGATKDLKTWILWYTNLPEPQFAKGNLVKSTGKSILQRTGLALIKVLTMAVLLSTITPNQKNILPIIAMNNSPYYQQAIANILNNYFQLWWIYLWVSFCLDFGALLLMLQGVATEPSFDNPLLMSRSYREAWGERWNRPIHLCLKRSVYKPLRRVGIRPPAAISLTFVASGLLHEYDFFCRNYQGYHFGYATIFFVSMGILMTLEETIPWPSRLKQLSAAVPTPVLAIVLQLPIVPIFVPLFFNSWIESGHLESVAKLLPHWECPPASF